MRNSKVLKGICYILIPFLVLAITLPMMYETSKEELLRSKKEENINYFETDSFLSRYMSKLSHKSKKLIFDNATYKTITDAEYRICYDENNDYEDEYYKIKDYYYLIMYKNLALTNVELTTNTSTLNGIKDFISAQDTKKSNIINGTVEAESDLIKTKAIQYFDDFIYNYYSVDNLSQETTETEITEVSEQADSYIDTDGVEHEYVRTSSSEVNAPVQGRTYYTTTINDFQIYTSYKEEVLARDNDIFLENLVSSLQPYEQQMLSVIPIASIILIVILIYLIISIGHTKNKDVIDLNDLDKIPIEIILFIAFMGLAIIAAMVNEGILYVTEEYYNFAVSMILTGYFIGYVLCAITSVTIIKRIKAKTLIKDSITGKVFRWCIKVIKKVLSKISDSYKQITTSIDRTAKLLVYVLAFGLGAILMIMAFNGFGLFIDLCVFAYCLYKFIQKMNCYHKIEEHLKKMYEGDNTRKLISSEFTPEFQNIITYINDISSGFENAIEEGIKSERLKTELITNVSHDIKTPLTSIINYVDLIKKEESENEKIKEYVDILDNKSQRLKRLTEDLVEASKASSGNVKLNLERINTVELIKQSVGEFEDKFLARHLEVITSTSSDEIFIKADNRYLYRVIENLFVNISKYALENSRVYIDIGEIGSKVRITIKNISKERLNISADELMQRFVRGDKSRTTEGSGLGISISKSLTELQKGKFDLQVDGDLFKVELEFDIQK